MIGSSQRLSVRFTVTPRTRRLGTSSMPGSGGGSTPFRRAENMTITRRGLNDKVTGQCKNVLYEQVTQVFIYCGVL